MSQSRKRKPVQKITRRKSDLLEEAANNAADESESPLDFSFNSPEERDQAIATHETENLEPEELDERDVFVDALTKARARNTSVKFRIYRDGEMLTTINGPYGWDQLQSKWGPGYYKVVAVNRDNAIMGTQVQQLAAPEGWNAPPAPNNPQERADATLLTVELMKDSQREAEAKAREQNGSMATVMASVMTAMSTAQQNMMTMQQQSNERFQMLMMEMQKESRAQQTQSQNQMMTLVTTLLTKGKDEGNSKMDILKLVMDAESRAENRTNKWYELIEKKAEALAEEKADARDSGEESESLTKSVVKGFIPLLTQVLAAHGQSGQPMQGQPTLPPPPERKPMTPEQAARVHNAREQKRLAALRAGPAQRAESLAGSETPNVTQTLQNGEKALRGIPGNPDLVENTKVAGSFDRLKSELFEKAAPMIGEALMGSRDASSTAELVLKQLEKDGYERQTVCKAFGLEEFYQMAAAAGLPAAVKPWLKEFHEALAKLDVSPTSASTEHSKPPENQKRANRGSSIRTAEPIPVR